MSRLSISKERIEGAGLLRLGGRLDSYSVTDLEPILLEYVTNNQNVLVDFAELEFISSAGLRVMLMAAKRSKQANGQFVLYGMDENVRKVFEMSGFLGILQVFDNQNEAHACVTSA